MTSEIKEKSEISEIPKSFGTTYSVIREIGRGGMGAVYLAYDNKLKRKVAIKQLILDNNPDFTPEEVEQTIYNFKREAIAIATLNHPKIVNVYDIEQQDDSTHYIVMELIKGIPLSEVLQKYTVSPEVVLSFMFQLCDVLSYIHQNGVIHRDIKPENIIYAGKGNVKLTDFGVAKFENDPHFDDYKREDVFTGTVLYMSPEQLTDPNSADERSDLYSFAVTLYEMLTGELPFNGEDVREVIMKILTEPPRPIVEIIEDFPESLDEIILKALAKNPDDRFANVAEFEQALLKVIEFKSIQNSQDFKFVPGKKINAFTRSGVSSGGTNISDTNGTKINKLGSFKLKPELEEEEELVREPFIPTDVDLKWLDKLDILMEKGEKTEHHEFQFKKSLEILIPKFFNENAARIYSIVSQLDIDDISRFLSKFDGQKSLRTVFNEITGSNFLDKMLLFSEKQLISEQVSKVIKELDYVPQLNDGLKDFIALIRGKFKAHEVMDLMKLIDGKKSIGEIAAADFPPEKLEYLFNLLYEANQHKFISFDRKPDAGQVNIELGEMLSAFSKITEAQLELAIDEARESKDQKVEDVLVDLGYLNNDTVANVTRLQQWYAKLFQ